MFIQKDVSMNFEVDVLKASLVSSYLLFMWKHIYLSWLIFYNEDHNAE